MVLASLVMLGAVVLTLEIQRQLLFARILSALVMLLGWVLLLSSEQQLQAICCAVVYHGLAEGLRQWQRSFPCVFERRKDRKVVLWLLFWARVYTWGTTLGGIAVLTVVSRSHESTRVSYWHESIILALYHEIVEVLVMLYFADEEVPYIWYRRIGHWLGALLVGFLKSSGRLEAALRGPLLAEMSSVALISVLLVVMWFSIKIPWDRIAEASTSSLFQDESYTENEPEIVDENREQL